MYTIIITASVAKKRRKSVFAILCDQRSFAGRVYNNTVADSAFACSNNLPNDYMTLWIRRTTTTSRPSGNTAQPHTAVTVSPKFVGGKENDMNMQQTDVTTTVSLPMTVARNLLYTSYTRIRYIYTPLCTICACVYNMRIIICVPLLSSWRKC